MATLNLTQHFSVTVGGEIKEAGSLVTSQSISVDGHLFECRTTVATEYIDEILWTAGNGNIDDFDFLWFESDQDVFLELRNTQATDEFLLVEVKADIPFVLASDNVAGYQTTTRFDDAELAEATDWDQVDQITVQNNTTGSTAATVRLVLIT